MSTLTSRMIMNSKLLWTYFFDLISDAYHLMNMQQIRHLPVFDSDKKLVGMLSDRDILRAIVFDEKLFPM